jgi:hypothetical protein
MSRVHINISEIGGRKKMTNSSPYTDAKKRILEEYRKMLQMKYQTQECTDRQDALEKAFDAIIKAREVCDDTALSTALSAVDSALGREIAWWNMVGTKMKALEKILDEFGFQGR